MKVSNNPNMRKYIVVTVLALVAALALEILVFMRDTRVEVSGESASLFDECICESTAIGYTVSGNRYTQVTPDPQFIFFDIDRTVSSILVSFAEPVYTGVNVQVFYRDENTDFSSDHVTAGHAVPFGATEVVVAIPSGYCDALRIDINGSFALKDIAVSDAAITVSTSFDEPFDFLQFLVMFAFFAVAGIGFLRWKYTQKNERKLTGIELLFCLGCFAYYFLWAVAKPLNYAPDELMRYDVTQFLYEHNRLPVGDEVLSIWGFSYAHIPTVLCNLLGYLFMKVASVFTVNERALLLAARMANVLCGVGSVYYTVKISKLMFHSAARWIMIVVLAFMPQFAFLTSYINNDMVAFLGITMIVYAWTLGLKYNWNFKNAALLSVGISVCALSYYNSYAWILCSIFFFFITYFYKNRRDYKGVAKLTAFIVGLTFLLIGYAFIRHLVVYGDLMGFKTSAYYGELYAIDSLKPSNRYTLLERGIPLMTMLFDPTYKWFVTTWASFIGNFGFMQFSCPEIVYQFVTLLVAVGGIGLVIRIVADLFFKRKKPDVGYVAFWILAALAAIVTVMLSIYNSYTSDFQPQGRYCYPAFLALAFFLAKGYEWFLNMFKKQEHQYAAVSALCTGFAAISAFVFWTVYLPS